MPPSPHPCTTCRAPAATIRRECNPPDASTEVFRWFCSSACETAWDREPASEGCRVTPDQAVFLRTLTRAMTIIQIAEAISGSRTVEAHRSAYLRGGEMRSVGWIEGGKSRRGVVWSRTESGTAALAGFDRREGAA